MLSVKSGASFSSHHLQIIKIFVFQSGDLKIGLSDSTDLKSVEKPAIAIIVFKSNFIVETCFVIQNQINIIINTPTNQIIFQSDEDLLDLL
jgi:hypothetical protein